jgi:hypothetical protein
MLVLVQEDVQRRVVFDESFKGYVGCFPASADRNWLATREFEVAFTYWKEQLSGPSGRRDVFLGYCSTSDGTAQI